MLELGLIATAAVKNSPNPLYSRLYASSIAQTILLPAHFIKVSFTRTFLDWLSPSFRRHLKTFLFQRSFPDVIVTL